MMKCNLPVGIMLLVVVLLLPLKGVASGSVVVDRVVAVVNGEIITLSDLQREEALKKKADIKQDERATLEDMINRKLQVAAAKRAGMDVTDKELTDAIADITKKNNMDPKQFEEALAKEGLTLDQYKIELREQMTLSRMFNKYVRSNIAVDEAEARAFFQTNVKNYTLPEEVRVRQIYIALPDKASPDKVAAIGKKAQTVYDRVKKGEDFIRLVREVSEGATVSQDGDLGFIQRDQVVPEIAEIIQTLKPGESSPPFLSAGGYNIIKLEEVRSPVKPYEKVKDEIMNTLYQQKLEHTYRNWLQSLRSDSHIENKL
jgi:peptidyl-prolyl cis-trans isomerase SurA